MRLFYTLKTLDPVIVSQNNATATNHECLDYIPGSAILGAMAANHYAALKEDDSWSVFHNGACRFSPCYAITSGQLSLPTPASWHYPKGKTVIDRDTDQYNTSVLTNLSAASDDRDETIQYKQCRDGYLASDGTAAEIQQGLSTKTAINSATGKAKDNQLFSYAYLEVGQTFAGWIDCDVPEFKDKLTASLNRTLRIGRSRNTEFGRVELQQLDVAKQARPANRGNRVVLWCLSDCELLDENGLPTLTPSARSIHATLSGRLDRQLSFIRGTRISRFNQKRRGLDSEQLLIGKGSVLVFTLESPAVDKCLDDISNNGIGLNLQQGLGWVNVNPDWAEDSEVSGEALFEAITIEHKPGADAGEADPTSNLSGWVQERVKDAGTIINVQRTVSKLLIDIHGAYTNARRYNNILNRNEAGPSSTQWRRIASEVRVSNDMWSETVFSGNHPICNAKNDELGWGIQWYNGKALTNFSDFTCSALGKQKVAVMHLLLEQLCRYDLSTFHGIEQMAKDLNLNATAEEQPLDKGGQ